jgi:hypothetical protein
MNTSRKWIAALAAGVILAGCDKQLPSVNTSKSEADTAASSALNAARAAAVNTGEALKDTAVAAGHEADAALQKTRESTTSGDVQNSMQRVGNDAKQAVTVAVDKTKELAADAKDKPDSSAKP